MASVFEVTIGVVKFFCGTFVDKSPSPGLLLGKCLCVAGVSSILLVIVLWTAGDSFGSLRVALVSLLWSTNGAGQAVAWPALACVFLAWFPDVQTRGTWYSILATNQNVGGTLSPIIYPVLIENYGWESAILPPALLTLCFAGLLLLNLHSKPPSAMAVKGKTKLSSEPTTTESKPGSSRNDTVSEPGFVDTFIHLLSSTQFIMLALAYIPIMVIRQSLINWTAVIFESSGMSLKQAGVCIAALEFGGFIGGLTAGYLSDTFFSGKRGPVMTLFSLACVPFSLALPYALQQSSPQAMSIHNFGLQMIFFLIGFCSFPPHSLIGLMSREISPNSMKSTAGCVAKATGQLGAAAAGWPLHSFCASYGWKSVGYVNALAGALAAVTFLPLWNTAAVGSGKIRKG